VKKAGWINGKGALGDDFVGSYSNRAQLALTPIASDIYTADRPFFWNSIDVSCRATVVVSEHNVWVHSPVDYDPSIDSAMARAIDGEGGVSSSLKEVLRRRPEVTMHVITPNYEHMKFAGRWSRAFADFDNVKILGCPGVTGRGDADYDGEMCVGDEEHWDYAEFEPLHVSAEWNPFTKTPFFNEVVFFYPREGAFICTDLFWNYPYREGGVNGKLKARLGMEDDEEDFGTWELAPEADVRLRSRAWKFGMDEIFKPFYMKFMVRPDKMEEWEKIVDTILEWDVRLIVPAHGDIIRGSALCKEVLRSHFGR